MLTKKQEDLLAKRYCLQSFALLTLTSAAGPFNFKARTSKRTDSSIIAKGSLEVKHGDFTFTHKRKTDGSGLYSFEYAASPDLKFKSECKPGPSGYEGTMSAEYSQPSYKAKVALIAPNHALKLTGTFGDSRVGMAIDGKYDLATSRLVAYNFAHYWFLNSQRFVLKHTGSDATRVTLGDFTASFYQSLSENTCLGAVAKYSVPKKTTLIEFGGSHAVSPVIEVKGKVSSLGYLSAAVTKTWAASKLTVAAEVDLKKAAATQISDYKLGVRVDLTA